MTSETLAYALAYARRGWRVFPLAPGKKTPAVKAWQDRATTDEDQVRAWFTGTGNGVGIATGPASGLLVIDVDLKNGQRGDLSLDALQEDLGELPEAPTQVTVSGGRHLLFAYPAGKVMRNTAGLRPGIDTRGAGGYIVGAPTSVGDGAYGWDGLDGPEDVAAAPLPPLPDAWVRVFEARIDAKSKQGKSVAASLASGARNETLTRTAGWMRREGYSQEMIAASLMALNTEACDPPLPADEVRAIARSVQRYEPGRSLPDESPRDTIMAWADRMLSEPAAEVMLAWDRVAPAASIAAAEDAVWWAGLLDLLVARGAGKAAVSAVKKSVAPRKEKSDAPRDTPAGQHLAQDFPAAGLPAGLEAPPGYMVTTAGVVRVPRDEDAEPTEVAPAPVFLDHVYRDGDTERESVRLVWLRRGEWTRRVVPRSTAAVTRDLAAQAEYGMPVTSVTSGALAQWLAALEAHNAQRLPLAEVTERCGWHGPAFVLPRETVGATSPAWHQNDEGLRQLGMAVASSGSMETWRRIVQQCVEHPWVRLAVAASLVPPYLQLVGASNFLLDLGGRTSSGKTTTLRLAASCWGSPDEAEGASFLRSWSATRTAIERTAALLSCLPTILDETKRATGPGDTLGSICYDLASGQGRGRGTSTGMQRTTATRTVVLTSGEQPLLELTTHQGLVGRVIQITGSPFGTADQRTLVETVREITDRHYGYAGPAVVRSLVESPPEGIADRVRQCRKDLQATATSTDPLVGRLCAHYAVLAVCGQHAMDTLGIECDVLQAVRLHLAETDRAMGGRDQARLALELVMALPSQNPDAFQRGESDRTPSGGFLGARHDSRWVYHPEALRRYLDSSGFRPGEVLTIWRERGWLRADGDRPTVKMTLFGERPRVVDLTDVARAAVGEATAGFDPYPVDDSTEDWP